MKNSDRFLRAYNKIENRLRQLTGQRKGTSFYTLVNGAASRNHAVRRYKHDLKEFGDLRNAIVHTRAGDRVITEPNDQAMETIERTARLLVDPPQVGELFRGDVFCLQLTDPIGRAAKAMLVESYSQIPVYNGDDFAGLLTTNTVGRWVGSCVQDDIFIMEEPRIADVLGYTEDEDNHHFLGRRATLFEALQAFDSYEQKGKRLGAILITEHGKPSESLLGIITIWDLPKIHQELAT